MRFEAVLFDLDGTLVDTPAAWMEACLGTLAAHGVECDAERFLRDYYSQNRSLQSVLDECGLGDKMVDFRRDRDDHYESLLRGRDLWLPGALGMLEWLAERASMAIVTAAWRRYVDAMDARVHLDRLMGTIVTGEDHSAEPTPGLLACAGHLRHPSPDVR